MCSKAFQYELTELQVVEILGLIPPTTIHPLDNHPLGLLPPTISTPIQSPPPDNHPPRTFTP